MGDAISCLQIPYALLMAISLTLFLLCIPTITTLVQIIITSDTEGKKILMNTKIKLTNTTIERVLEPPGSKTND